MNATVIGNGKVEMIRIRHNGLDWNFAYRYEQSICRAGDPFYGTELILDIADMEELETLDRAIMECKEAMKMNIGRLAFIGTT